MLMCEVSSVLFAPRGVFCIAASRLPLRCHPPEAAMAVVAMAELAELAELAEAEADVGGGDGVVASAAVGRRRRRPRTGAVRYYGYGNIMWVSLMSYQWFQSRHGTRVVRCVWYHGCTDLK